MNSDEYDYFCNKNISMSEQTKNPNEINKELSEKISEGISENLTKFENQYGIIQDPEPPSFPPMSFNTPTAQA